MMRKVLYLIIFFQACVWGIPAQSPDTPCSSPLPGAKFYIENQTDSPIVIRNFAAELVSNPGDLMGYKRIRVTFYFENRSSKTIKTYLWDNPSPDASEWIGGGITSSPLLPGESHRFTNVFAPEHNPATVFRISEVNFRDGTKWRSKKYQKNKVLETAPICVKTQIWPTSTSKRSLTSDGWQLPVFADRDEKVIDAGTTKIDGVKVHLYLHQIRRERLDELRVCPPDEMLRIAKDRALDYDVEKYTSYTTNGKIFAYLINYEYVDEKNQSEIGASSASFYVDKNGDGLFSLQCNGGNINPKLPQWIKNPKRTRRTP